VGYISGSIKDNFKRVNNCAKKNKEHFKDLDTTVFSLYKYCNKGNYNKQPETLSPKILDYTALLKHHISFIGFFVSVLPDTSSYLNVKKKELKEISKSVQELENEQFLKPDYMSIRKIKIGIKEFSKYHNIDYFKKHKSIHTLISENKKRAHSGDIGDDQETRASIHLKKQKTQTQTQSNNLQKLLPKTINEGPVDDSDKNHCKEPNKDITATAFLMSYKVKVAPRVPNRMSEEEENNIWIQ
jgi:hypothetical protein